MTIRNRLATLPFIGDLGRIVINILNLSDNINQINAKQQELSELTEKSRDELIKTKERLDALVLTLQKNITQIRYINNRLNGLSSNKDRTSSKNNDYSRFADNHLLDDFYLEFENKFRGDRAEIRQRLSEYMPLFEDLKKQNMKKPVLDIGCGRGEMLDILRSKKINAKGIDINKSMVKECLSKGFEVVESDAITYLTEIKAKSLSAITGFHIVEHIEFSDLLDLFSKCYRAVEDNGLVLFETPNPENIYVGANTFYYDPSHLKPLPPPLLKFAMETVGFRSVEITYLHPEAKNVETDKNDAEIFRRLFGPRDYAVIARK